MDNNIKDWQKERNNAIEKLNDLHNKIKIKYGHLNDEFEEQIMAMIFIKPESKVLEIGGNIGRNSCIIANILEKSDNLTVLESDPKIYKKLKENQILNNLNFMIENSAISKTQLYQKKWSTFNYQVEGSKLINCITYEYLLNKFNINYDVLVLDCEGAFYYILIDFPEILKNINLIIIENDYEDISHFMFVYKKLIENGFEVVYTRKLKSKMPCKNFFYQVYKKI